MLRYRRVEIYKVEYLLKVLLVYRGAIGHDPIKQPTYPNMLLIKINKTKFRTKLSNIKQQ